MPLTMHWAVLVCAALAVLAGLHLLYVKPQREALQKRSDELEFERRQLEIKAETRQKELLLEAREEALRFRLEVEQEHKDNRVFASLW